MNCNPAVFAGLALDTAGVMLRESARNKTHPGLVEEQDMKTIKILVCGVAVGVLVLLGSMISHIEAAGNEVNALNVSIRE